MTRSIPKAESLMWHQPCQCQEAEGAAADADAMARGLLGAGVCGFMRSMPLEAPQLKTQVLDLSGSPGKGAEGSAGG